jgi:hypothetical protein
MTSDNVSFASVIFLYCSIEITAATGSPFLVTSTGVPRSALRSTLAHSLRARAVVIRLGMPASVFVYTRCT